jgi:hypothetical protein
VSSPSSAAAAEPLGALDSPPEAPADADASADSLGAWLAGVLALALPPAGLWLAAPPHAPATMARPANSDTNRRFFVFISPVGLLSGANGAPSVPVMGRPLGRQPVRGSVACVGGRGQLGTSLAERTDTRTARAA